MLWGLRCSRFSSCPFILVAAEALGWSTPIYCIHFLWLQTTQMIYCLIAREAQLLTCAWSGQLRVWVGGSREVSQADLAPAASFGSQPLPLCLVLLRQLESFSCSFGLLSPIPLLLVRLLGLQ